MAIYCIHCGTQLPDVAQFCLKCGKSPRGDSQSTSSRSSLQEGALPPDQLLEAIMGSEQKETSKASTPSAARPKVEYKYAEVDLSRQKPPITFYAGGNNIADEDPQLRNYVEAETEPLILTMLKPYFDDGWQMDGTFKSAVSMTWGAHGFFGHDRKLLKARARLIRYR